MKERYQIVYKIIVCGNECICLCKEPTASGNDCFVYSKAAAEKRVAELLEAGFEARYEALPYGEAWFDNEKLD